MPDFFHVVHEIIKSYSLALGRHRRHTHQALKQAQEALARCQEQPYADHATPEATRGGVATRQAAVSRWEETHNSYRSLLETLALTLPPFRIADSAPQTSAHVASHLQATVAAIEELTQYHQLPVRYAAMTKVREPLPALAAVVDFWWAGVRRDVAHVGTRGNATFHRMSWYRPDSCTICLRLPCVPPSVSPPLRGRAELGGSFGHRRSTNAPPPPPHQGCPG
jgi:hypothetical protein